MPYGLDPGSDLQRDVPLEQQRANLGEYLNAVADDAWQSNPLPSLYRWHQRLAADYGQLGAPGRVLNAIVPGGGALFEQGLRALGATDQQFQPRTPWLSKEEAQFKGQELGLKLDRAMSQESFDSIAAARRRQMANEAVYERARLGEGYGPGRAALSVLLEFAVNAADPLNAATAFVPVGRLPGIVGRLEAISNVGAQRLARGALEGAAGAALAEPLVALAATDENPNYGFTSALTSVAFGTALGAGLHWLGGRLVDYSARGRETPPAPPRPAPRDILGQEPIAESTSARAGALPGEAALNPAERTRAATPEAPRPDVPQTTAAHIEALHPETRGALLETALRQAANDTAIDVGPIAQADRNWRPIHAADTAPPYRLAGWDPERIRQDIRELQTLAADTAQRLAGDRGRAFKAPEGYQPSPPELQAARDYVTAPKGVTAPESLATFVRRQGGLDRESVGAQELRAQDLGKAGLFRKPKYQGIDTTNRVAGKQIDLVAEAAWEAGYFKERPTVDEFVQALIEDASGQRKTYSAREADRAARAGEAARAKTAHESAMLHPIIGDLRGLSERDLAYWLSRDPLERRLAELDQLQHDGVISERESLDRAHLIDRAAALEEEAAARDLLANVERRPEGFEKDLEGAQPVVVAFQDQAGKTFYGRPGDTHADLFFRIENEMAPGPPKVYGFAFPGGAALTRQQMLARLAENHPLRAIANRERGGELHSGALKQLEETRLLEEAQTVTEAEHYAIAERSGLPAAPGEAVPGDLGRPGAAALGAERGAAGVGGEPRAPEAASALPRAGQGAEAARPNAGLTPPLFQARTFAEFNGTEKLVAAPESGTFVLRFDRDYHIFNDGRLVGRAEIQTNRNYPLSVQIFDQADRRRGFASQLYRVIEADIGPLETAAHQTASGRAFRQAFEQGRQLASLEATSKFRLDQPFDPAQFEAWIKRQADWRADAHADAAASARADALVEQRSTVTPEQDLAELKAQTDRLFGSDPAFKEELKAALAPIDDEKKALDAFASCRMGGSR